MQVTISLKHIAKRKNSVTDALFRLENKPCTVSELIAETVKTCVKEYNNRQQETELLKSLSKDTIDDMSETGKISFGGFHTEPCENYNKAFESAIQAYEDGIFKIFINEKEAGALTEPIVITEESKLVFIRLTMLAGRMW